MNFDAAAAKKAARASLLANKEEQVKKTEDLYKNRDRMEKEAAENFPKVLASALAIIKEQASKGESSVFIELERTRTGLTREYEWFDEELLEAELKRMGFKTKVITSDENILVPDGPSVHKLRVKW